MGCQSPQHVAIAAGLGGVKTRFLHGAESKDLRLFAGCQILKSLIFCGSPSANIAQTRSQPIALAGVSVLIWLTVVKEKPLISNKEDVHMSRKRTPDQEPQAETTTAVVEPPAPETNGNGKSFAERVGQTKRLTVPDPFELATDVVAGVHLFESRQDRQMAIKFDEKPSQAVLDKLHEARCRWKASDKIWTYPIRPDSARTTRIDAQRLYDEVRNMVRQDKGVPAGPEIPF